MKLTNYLILAISYASYSFAQDPTSIIDTGIMTIQPVTSIIPSSLTSTTPPATSTGTTTRLGGSQIEPSSYTTSRLTISDVSTDRPTRTTTGPSSTEDTTLPTSSSLPGSSIVPSPSSPASSPTATSNVGIGRFSAYPVGLLGALTTLSGIVLL
ncbi:hypothetical protein RSOLAG1IB_02688 [Rhizoctonia solani AG-1 IB]|uniref:Uncharacterized protein n=1 Tax=Thanatephorus cucumeris (strain AG1-IB / isolate 7/3/14) TaxID=1108050 RepID=A0A0B7FNZ6_THACB|nr:hypothetical protein RSOLAG1IB_02688 [Rhizoctonia solani AG-1 IB]